MTEVDWLICTDPHRMLELVRSKTSDRKFRLFQVACCRRIWDGLPSDALREAVCVAEEYADGRAGERKRQVARKRVLPCCATRDLVANTMASAVFYTLEKAVSKNLYRLGSADVFGRIADRTTRGAAWGYNDARSAAHAVEAHLIRCLFGKLRRKVDVPAEWKTDTVLSLARTMYDSRDFSAMPILADAL